MNEQIIKKIEGYGIIVLTIKDKYPALVKEVGLDTFIKMVQLEDHMLRREELGKKGKGVLTTIHEHADGNYPFLCSDNPCSRGNLV